MQHWHPHGYPYGYPSKWLKGTDIRTDIHTTWTLTRIFIRISMWMSVSNYPCYGQLNQRKGVNSWKQIGPTLRYSVFLGNKKGGGGGGNGSLAFTMITHNMLTESIHSFCIPRKNVRSNRRRSQVNNKIKQKSLNFRPTFTRLKLRW